MTQLIRNLPDLELLLGMEPEELAVKLLFALRAEAASHPMRHIHMSNLLNGLADRDNSGERAVAPERLADVSTAITEAWMWLEAQGLLIPAPGMNGNNGFRVLSRRAIRFEDEADFSRYSAARYLRKELLHPAIANQVWSAFLRGEYDVAVFQAMKAVEVAVRDAAMLPASEHGTPMARKAFHPETGKLTNRSDHFAEREALANLVAGAIGSYKNPHSHRYVDLSDPVEAMEVVMLANHLLRIVDARREAQAEGGGSQNPA